MYLYSTLEKHVKKQHGDTARGNKYDHMPINQHTFVTSNPGQRILRAPHPLVSAVMKDTGVLSRLAPHRNAALESNSLAPRAVPFAGAGLFNMNNANNNSNSNKNNNSNSNVLGNNASSDKPDGPVEPGAPETTTVVIKTQPPDDVN